MEADPTLRRDMCAYTTNSFELNIDIDILYIAIDYLDIASSSFAPTTFTCRSQPATETIPQHTE